MKEYPSIPSEIIRDLPIIAFNKYDGSSIRAEWDKKKGWHKFGTRTRLLDPNEKPLGEARDLFFKKYAVDVEKVLLKERHLSGIVFFEFFGENSFAGNHVEEPHDIILFDVNPYKKGILPPREFINLFGHLHIAEEIFTGKAGVEFEEKVRSSSLEGMAFEGVVCKGMHGKLLKMFKIKSRAWLDKLKAKCGEDEQLFKRLM